MNVHHLELFYYVARHRGISRALRHIPYGIQQPAVSSQLISLEKDLGVTLFRRRPFELTRRGEALYAFVRPFFGRMDEVKESLRHGARFLRIGAAETVIRDYLPEPLQRFRQSYPDLRLSLRGAVTSDLLDLLANGELDLAIGPVIGGVPRGIVVEGLLKVRLALMVPESEPSRTAAAFMKSRAGAVPLIALPLSHPLTRIFLDELARRGIDWTPTLELGGIDLVQTYVAGGFGVGLVIDEPTLSPPEGCRLLPLRRFPKLEIAAFHTGHPEEPVIRLLETIRESAKALRG